MEEVASRHDHCGKLNYIPLKADCEVYISPVVAKDEF
jgi:hypothetical protein